MRTRPLFHHVPPYDRERLRFDSYDMRPTDHGAVFRLWREGRAVEVLITAAELLDSDRDLVPILSARGEEAWARASLRHRMRLAIRRGDDLQSPSPL